MQKLLETYRDRLTDLSKRNSSLRLFKLTNKNHFDVATLTVPDETNPLRVLREIINKNSTVTLLSASGTSEDEMLLNRKLTYLKREIDLIEQETGANTFHVAFGFLEGTLVEDFYLRSPVLLYPAHLTKRKIKGVPYWSIEIDEDNPPFLNPVLDLALRKFLGVNLSENVQSSELDVPNENVLEFISSLMKSANLNVTVENSNLLPFKQLKQSELPKERVPFSLKPYMVMGKFRQSTSNLLVDYEELLKNRPSDGLLYRLLNEEPSDEQLSEVKSEIVNEVKESETFFVLDTDVSQEAAVISSRDRDGLIVHGPPGTGKSQVIVNLIADRLARGQRVLVVCQKAVALEVVYNRLSGIELHHQVALVHDVNKDKAMVYGKIGTVMQRDQYFGTTGFERVSEEMDELANRLNQVASSLHKERDFGKTLQSLYSNALWDQNLIIDVSDLAPEMSYDSLQQRMVDLKVLLSLLEKYDHPNYPFSNRNSFSGFRNKEHMELNELLKSIIESVKRAKQIVETVEIPYAPLFLLQNKDSLLALKRAVQIIQGKNVFKHVHMFYTDEQKELEHEDQVARVKQMYQSFTQQLSKIKELSEPIGDFTELEAREWAEKIDQFLEVHQKFRRFFSAQWYGLKKDISDYCTKHKILFDGKAVRKHRAAIEAFLMFEGLRKNAIGMHFFSDVPIINEMVEWETWLRRKQNAIEFLEQYVDAQSAFEKWLPDLVTQEDLNKLLEDTFVQQVDLSIELSDFTQRLKTSFQTLRRYLINDEVTQLEKDINGGIYHLPTFERLQESITDFDSLVRLDRMKDQMDGVNQKLLTRCSNKVPIESTPSVVELWTKIMENSFIHAWIDLIEREEPHLADVSTEVYQQYRKRYVELLKEKRKKVPQWIDKQLASKVTDVRGQGRTVLKNEAGKKRRLKPLRQVIGEYTSDVLNLVPCWLCTPEAVSAIFPAEKGLFDLVIFDEASQCPVENAIPSIYRGKQVVVAGDEKQLPPTNLFRIVEEDDDVEDETIDYIDDNLIKANHLLEWSKPKMADQWLTWHYRSAHDALINFSNYTFYGKRMQTAPISSFGGEKPIEFIRVNGTWLSRQNREEAEKIADIVVDILQNDPSEPTLGIITFNADQAELINDVLDSRGHMDPEVQDLIDRARQRKKEDQFVGLFVKNIENVQGDERDIILFSVAYAKDQDGKMVSQFGSLSQDMGENRLNVAITRARKKVYIACSFEPSEWTRVDTYTSRGPRLLKKYLEYAKAVSDGDQVRVQTVLDNVLDATAVQSISTHSVYDSPFEEEVATALRNRGYTVETQVGFSGYRIDLAIVHPNNPEKYLLGVECDGAMYHSSKVARERDFYRQRFLEQNGWNIHRVWSRNWWKGKENELLKIQQTIDRLMSNQKGEVRKLKEQSAMSV